MANTAYPWTMTPTEDTPQNTVCTNTKRGDAVYWLGEPEAPRPYDWDFANVRGQEYARLAPGCGV